MKTEPAAPVDPPPEATASRFSRMRLGPWRHAITAALLAAVLAIVWVALSKFAGEVSYRDVARELADTPWSAVAASVVLTGASFLALTLYDVTALHYVGKPRPYPAVALTSFFAYSVGNIAGFGPLTGGAIRYHFYSRMGLDAADVGKIVAFVTATFGIGIAAVTCLGLIFVAEEVAAPLGIAPGILHLVGGSGGLAILGLVLASARGLTPRIGRFARALPRPGILVAQLAAAALDIVFAASALWFLLPAGAIPLPGMIAAYAVAVGLGVLSHVPGGIGVFEAVIVAVVGAHAPIEQVLGALILFRAIYYVLPLIAAALMASLLEAGRIARGPAASQVIRAGGRSAPRIISALTFLSGAVLILSGVTPATERALGTLTDLVPLPVVESAHFLASVLGLGLLLIARGLAFRLDGAWWAAMVAIPLAIVLSLLKAVAFVEAVLLALLAVALFMTRREFTRPSSLIHSALSPVWLMAIGTILTTATAILFFAYSEVEYSNQLWWQFEMSEEAPRSLRALLGVALAAGGVAVWSLMRQTPQPAHAPSPEEMARALAIVEAQDNPDANLVRMGDKNLMFSADGRAFIMYAVQARSWVALFDPVGPFDAWPALIWQFVETARSAGGRAVFYQVGPERLALYADAGLQAFKLGEEARIDLADFDLKGPKRSGLRQTLSRGGRDGLEFEYVPVEGVPSLLDEIERISNAWLDQHRAREKRFSLGAFQREYVAGQPVAVLRLEGRIVAFATVMTTATKREATVDLMRFEPGAPRLAMEFLFTALCSHFKAQGYRWFSLGMAPLSGLSESPAAPLWHRIGRTMFEHGERFYNFRGLRAFKGKFHPEWRPRYLAVFGGIEPAMALANTAALIGGGFKGVLRK